MKKVLIVLLAVLFAVMPLFGCQKSASDDLGLPKAGTYPMTIKDGNGAEVTFKSEVKKVVSLAPSVTEILFAVGAGDMVAAVSNWCNYPAEAQKKEKVGDTYSVNLERIIELDPDVVFVAGSFATDVQDALNQAGIEVYSANEVDIDDVYYSILAVGTITNKLDKAEEVVDGMKADLKELEKAVAKVTEKKVFIDLGMLYSSSKLSLQGNIFGMINAKNIALDYDISAPQLSAEEVIEANPDVYICMSSKAFYVQPDGFDEISAFKNGEVYYIDFTDPIADIVSRPGPRCVEGMKVFAKMIYPDLKITSEYLTDLAAYK